MLVSRGQNTQFGNKMPYYYNDPAAELFKVAGFHYAGLMHQLKPANVFLKFRGKLRMLVI
jgi:hypothetical protein